MSDTTRTVLIALGVALIVVALVPLLAATGMMGGGMMGWTMGGGMMSGWALPILVIGGALLAVGLWRRS